VLPCRTVLMHAAVILAQEHVPTLLLVLLPHQLSHHSHSCGRLKMGIWFCA
jgi:hypothetical protein